MELTKLDVTTFAFNIALLNENHSKSKLQIFKHDLVVYVLPEIVGVFVYSVACDKKKVG